MAHRKREQQASRGKPTEEEIKHLALQALEIIYKRLSGKLPPNVENVISPADQVAALISEATDPVNLVSDDFLERPHLFLTWHRAGCITAGHLICSEISRIVIGSR